MVRLRKVIAHFSMSPSYAVNYKKCDWNENVLNHGKVHKALFSVNNKKPRIFILFLKMAYSLQKKVH